MNIAVLSPTSQIFEGEITSVKVPGVSGQFEVLSGHAPIVSALAEGEVRIAKSEGGELKFTIQNGFIEVLNNEVSLLVEGAVM